MNQAAIVVVGSINADYVIGVPQLPAPGATVLATGVDHHAGGKGANQAVAAARLGEAVTLIGCVGADEAGERQLGELRRAGVDVSAIRIDADEPTGSAFVMVGDDGENCIVVASGANFTLGPADVTKHAAVLKAASVAVVQCEIPVPVLAEVAGVCARAGTRLVVNCAPATELPDPVLAAADPLVVNQGEAAALLARPVAPDDAEAAVHELVTRGPRSAVITLGADGAVAMERGESAVRMSSPAVDVVDTTGAGDAFVAALASTLRRGAALPEAVDVAVRAGAFAVTRSGARTGFPSRAELNVTAPPARPAPEI